MHAEGPEFKFQYSQIGRPTFLGWMLQGGRKERRWPPGAPRPGDGAWRENSGEETYLASNQPEFNAWNPIGFPEDHQE